MKRRQLLPVLFLATFGVCSGAPPTEWATGVEEANSNASYRDAQIVSASIDGSRTWVGPVGKLRSLQTASNGAHRDVRVMPTFHLATDHLGGTIHADVLRAGGLTGKGVALGVVDSGLDLRHADFQNADGTTRVKWFIDFGLPLSGRYPELEKKFGIPSEDVPCEIKTPAVCYGAIGYNLHGVDESVDLQSIADAALTRLEVDHRGLDGFDKRYLTLIAENFGGGPVGIETIAAALGEARDAIEEIVEPYLMQQGFVQRTPRGRLLTGQAYGHLGLAAPPRDPAQIGLLTGEEDR